MWQDSGKTVPADLTGVTGKAEIRSAPGGTLITSMVVTITTPNIAVVSLPATNSALLPKTGGTWDLQLTYTNSDVATVLVGPVTVTIDVTDSASMMATAAAAPPQQPVIPGRPVP
jgi:hypothetical protein